MKKLLLLLLIGPFLKPAAAQTAADFHPQKWQFGLLISPDYSYRNLEATSGSVVAADIKKQRNASEKPLPGVTAGLDARRFMSRHWGLSVGVQISRRRYGTHGAEWVVEDQYDPKLGTVTGQEYFLRSWSAYNYVDLPVAIVYRSNAASKLAVTASAGLAVNILMNGRSYFETQFATSTVKRVDEMKGLSSINLRPFISAGIEYRSGDRFRLKAEPVFRYSLLPVADGVLKERQWSAGLQLAAYWNL